MRAPLLLALLVEACACPRTSPGELGHFDAAGPLRDAVFQGEQAEVARLATALEGGPSTEGGGVEAERAVLAVHGAAGFLMASQDLVDAGEGLAAMARACGDCHAVSVDGAPGAATLARRAMDDASMDRQHARIADGLWWSLVGHDPDTAGRALVRACAGPIVPPEGPGGDLAAGILQQAVGAEGGELERAEIVFAAVAGRCAACHALQQEE